MKRINHFESEARALRLHLAGGALAVTASMLLAGPGAAVADDDEIEFDVAEVFFELNDTDGDLGIHALIDGDAWKRLEIEDTRERKVLDVQVRGRLRRQGLTEIFFESAEPTFDELRPKKFFRRFPAGEYEIEGRTLDGEELESETQLTHVMPAPAVPTVNSGPMATICDEDDPNRNITMTTAPVIISWPEVTMSHPDPQGGGAGVQPPVPVTIYNYEVVVETEVETELDEEFEAIYSIIVPPNPDENGMLSVTVPPEFLDLAEEFKYEILAREESFNQTAVESCFELMQE